MKTTNKNIFEQSFDGQRLYRAKNDAYEFDIFQTHGSSVQKILYIWTGCII